MTADRVPPPNPFLTVKPERWPIVVFVVLVVGLTALCGWVLSGESGGDRSRRLAQECVDAGGDWQRVGEVAWGCVYGRADQ